VNKFALSQKTIHLHRNDYSEKPTLLRTRGERRCSWKVSSSRYAYGTGIVAHCLSHKKNILSRMQNR